MENLGRGRVAVITGGATGIGLAIAGKLAARGVDLAIVGRRPDVVDHAAADLEARHGVRVLGVACDVRRSAEVRDAVARVVDRLGRLDVLVNNAGIGVTARIEDCSDEEWDLVLDTNLKGTFLMTRAALPHMRRLGEGFILNVASQAAMHGYSEAGPYCASKFGIVGFGEALQKEVRAYGIQVHSICPALVQVPAPATPHERQEGVLQAEDVAEAAVFAMSQPGRVRVANLGLYHSSWSPD
jgi:meso-butanediol dehydrogenase/(S,S)-butanediol dehydrogenase/diacetyl reductase